MTLLLVFSVCVAGGAVPFLNADLFVVAIASVVRPSQLPWVIVVATAGQVLGKALTYVAAGRLVSRRRAQSGILEVLRRTGAAGDALIFVSALASVPPFFAVSLAAGAAEFGLLRFVLAASAGRAIRTAVFVSVPGLLRGGF